MKTFFLYCTLAFILIHPTQAQKIIAISQDGSLNHNGIIEVPTVDNILRFRPLTINPKVQSTAYISLNDTLMLDLFADARYKAIVENLTVDVNGTVVITAKLLNFEYAYCFISTYNNKSLITVDIPDLDENYSSWYNHQNNSYYLIQTDDANSASLEGGMPITIPSEKVNQSNDMDREPSLELPEKQGNSGKGENDPETITLMIVYTPAAAAWSLANQTDINNTISLLMASANLVLSNSNTYLQLQLVHSEEVPYVELNDNNDLYNLRNNGDGIMDNVHTLRDTYCADIVMLLENISFTGGLGYLLTNPSGSPTYAFSLVRVQQASGSSYTAIHEIGHNMGGHHHIDQNTQPGPGIYSYSAGWRWTGTSEYCSVMTYTSGTYFLDGITHSRVPYFSNPDISYQGIAVGDSTDGDNARTIRQVKTVISAYRNGCCVQPLVQATAFTASGITNNLADIGWTRGNGNSVLVLARQGSAVNAVPVCGNSYTANAAFGSGSQIGSGNFVVYNDTGTSVNLTSLSPGLTYYFAVYEYDTTSFCYTASPLTGNLSTLLTGPPVTGTAAHDTSICEGSSVLLVLAGYSGNIQWQESADGTTGWANVTGGSGATTSNYTTALLNSSNYYRAEVTQIGYTADHSNVVLVTVNPTYDLVETVQVCKGGSYTFPDGNTQNNITSTVVHTSNLLTSGMLCDSIIVTTVNLIPIDTAITLTGNLLTSDETGASAYQWLDCDNGFAVIPGEINQSFTAILDGNYAVQITIGSCIDTSVCEPFVNVGINSSPAERVSIYPNPANGMVTIDLGTTAFSCELELINSMAQVVHKSRFTGSTTITTTDYAPGIYVVRLQWGTSGLLHRIILE